MRITEEKISIILGALVVIVLGALLVGYFEGQNREAQTSSVREESKAELEMEVLSEDWGTSVKVFEDKERGVVCWVLTGNRQGGLSCIPKKMLEN